MRLLIFSLIASLAWSCASTPTTLTIGFYNVENLFDTLDNPEANDNDFLPDGKKQWNSERYWEKIDHIASVIDSMAGGEAPELLGLCEVENGLVMNDLISDPLLAGMGYEFILREGPDHRGIDVALMYQTTSFTPIWTSWFQLIFDGEAESSTREILYVKGIVHESETLHVFVNHWPSRVGGAEESAPLRWQASDLLFGVIDSIMRNDIEAKVVVLGDMNDTHVDESVSRLHVPTPFKDQLWVLDHAIAPELGEQRFPGTYNYQDNWDLLDHILYSRGISDAQYGIVGLGKEAGIYADDQFLYTSNSGKQYPNRSYGGTNYYGGYSDHLPVWVKFQFK